MPGDDTALRTLNFYGRLTVLISALMQLETAGNRLNSIHLTEDYIQTTVYNRPKQLLKEPIEIQREKLLQHLHPFHFKINLFYEQK